MRGCGLEDVALCLAREVLNPSRLMAWAAQIVDSTGLLFVDKRSYCRHLMLLQTAEIWTYP